MQCHQRWLQTSPEGRTLGKGWTYPCARGTAAWLGKSNRAFLGINAKCPLIWLLLLRIRTSSGAFLQRGQDTPIKDIEAKIAKMSGIPAENGEGLQILNYEASEKYEAHFDYFHDQVNQVDGGQRLATMLMYLTDVEEGGETVFPASQLKPVHPLSSGPINATKL